MIITALSFDKIQYRNINDPSATHRRKMLRAQSDVSSSVRRQRELLSPYKQTASQSVMKPCLLRHPNPIIDTTPAREL